MTIPDPTPESRKEYVERILLSQAERRLVVAGPGTGKSFLFAAEIDKYPGKPLLISFLRALVEEMEPKLGNKAIVRTFHSFCKLEFLKLHGDKYPELRYHYPPLGILMDADLALMNRSVQPLKQELEKAMQLRQGHPLLQD